MILAMLKVMILSLVRDRGALAMAFILPPTIFVIFAAIFSGTSGNDLRLQVAYGITAPSAAADRLETALRAEPALRVLPDRSDDATALAALVRGGEADAAILVRAALEEEGEAAPVLVLVDPGKAMAGSIAAGHVQRLIAQALPDVAIARSVPVIAQLAGGFDPAQQARLDAALAAIAQTDQAAQQQGQALVATQTLTGAGAGSATVTYYAGAVAILFLLFSAMQGAATLIEERLSGIVDRLAVGPAGTDVVVVGKFLFLTLQGVVQVGLIFVVALLFYGVDFLTAPLPWALTTLAAAAAAAGLGLLVAALCTSKQQAQTIATFVVLVCSAIGGSMVPRFMMPPWLQDIGWYTPNAWAIEAYHGVLWRGEGLAELTGPLIAMALTAVLGLGLSVWISRARLKL